MRYTYGGYSIGSRSLRFRKTLLDLYRQNAYISVELGNVRSFLLVGPHNRLCRRRGRTGTLSGSGVYRLGL